MSGATTLLVIDDDEDLREVIADALRREGHEVVEAENGRQALDHIAAHGLPHLILLDMNMPVMNGWDFARELRARGLWSVPVVVITAAYDAARSVAEVGAVGCLGKPFDLAALVSTVDRHLTPLPEPF